MKLFFFLTLLTNMALANDIQSAFLSESEFSTRHKELILGTIKSKVSCLVDYSLKEISTVKEVIRHDQMIDIYYVTYFTFSYYDGHHPIKAQMSVYSEDMAGNCNGPCLSVSKIDFPDDICPYGL